MNTRKYQLIFYFITLNIVATIAVQFYWNFKNYEQNKLRVKNEIQLSFDNAIEEYYASLAKSSYITVINAQDVPRATKSLLKKVDTLKVKKPSFTINNIKFTSSDNMSKEQIDSLMRSAQDLVKETMFTAKNKVSFTKFIDDRNGIHVNKDGTQKKIQYFEGKKAADSLRLVDKLQPVFISFLDDNIKYNKIDSLISNQLKNRKIFVQTSFIHFKNDTVFHQSKDSVDVKYTFNAISKSTYVKDKERFKLEYTNPSFEALKRSSFGISLSLFLSLLIISTLFYLLKVINKQKELAEIKNDLISNITHEFKTPIATVSTAIEAIESFNAIDNKEKTQKYLAMSSGQLKKLHQMVEKLLETATLDSEKLILKLESVDFTTFVERIVNKHKLIGTDKEVTFTSSIQDVDISIDTFHLENAISNLVDNAIKYGGEKVEVSVQKLLNQIQIIVADNGNGIEKSQQEKVFDKFYRVPKGNTHDVKGFGIGLYYTKKIIEKHKGSITLISNKQQTIFTINLPYES